LRLDVDLAGAAPSGRFDIDATDAELIYGAPSANRRNLGDRQRSQ
jgi:hypothetical protein